MGAPTPVLLREMIWQTLQLTASTTVWYRWEASVCVCSLLSSMEWRLTRWTSVMLTWRFKQRRNFTSKLEVNLVTKRVSFWLWARARMDYLALVSGSMKRLGDAWINCDSNNLGAKIISGFVTQVIVTSTSLHTPTIYVLYASTLRNC